MNSVRTAVFPRRQARRVPLSLLATAAAFFAVPALSAQTVDEVIASSVRARGGMEKLKSVRTLRISAKTLFGDIQVPVVQINKRPDKVREEASLQGLTQVQAYDGSSGWMIDPFGGRKDPQRMSEDDSKSLVVDADLDHPIVDYKEKGHTAELVGHDSVEGTDCYKIKLTLKNGDIFVYYLDADSYLELKLETQMKIRGTIQENETYYGDYEQVDGIYYPFAVETGRKGETFRQKTTVEKVEINTPLEDAFFVMPAAKAAAAPKGGSR
jgi:Outer membrane lipoprotein-sorting protein